MNQPNSALLEEIKAVAEEFIRAGRDLVLLENEVETIPLAGHEWRLAIEFGKLMFEVWSTDVSLAWRVDGIAYRGAGRLGFFAHKRGGREALTIELREASAAAPNAAKGSQSRHSFLAFLHAQYPGWRFTHVSNRTDREFSFSSWYIRGLAERNRAGWAFLALADATPPAASESALAYGLNWLDWLRERNTVSAITGLRIFLPAEAVPLNAHRAVCLDGTAARIEIFEWPAENGACRPIDLRDFGNVETRLTPRFQAGPGDYRRDDYLRQIFGNLLPGIEQVPSTPDGGISLRILGLEIGHVHGRISPRLSWGLEHQRRVYRPEEHAAFDQFVREALRLRNARAPDRGDDLYVLQPERWLESLLVRDITRLDSELLAGHVHPQVPAFAGGDRSVIDILAVRSDGRLAVVELKLFEEIGLPLQALDYWLRVKWLNERDQFRKFSYFPGVELATAPPVLYLVSPAFRFHSTTQRIVRYLNPSIAVFQVGINQRWRSELQVLFRRKIHG